MSITSLLSQNNYGLFQIDKRYWCQGSPENWCQTDCQQFLDKNIHDDIECARFVYNWHGYRAWPMFKEKCEIMDINSREERFLSRCDQDRLGPWVPLGKLHPLGPKDALDENGKRYTKCELVSELINAHFLPTSTVQKLVCLVERESSYKVTTQRKDEDYGIFQLNSEYWCDNGSTSTIKGGTFFGRFG